MVKADRETLQNEILRLIDDPWMQKQNLADLVEEETFNQIKETAKKYHLNHSVIHRIGVVYAAAGRVDKFEEVVLQSKREGADVGRTAQNLRDVGREIYKAMEVNEVVLELALTPGWNLESILAIRETLSSLDDSNSQGFSTQPQPGIDNNFGLRL